MPVSINLALRGTLAELTASVIQLEEVRDSLTDRIESIQGRIDSIREELRNQKA